MIQEDRRGDGDDYFNLVRDNFFLELLCELFDLVYVILFMFE